MGKPSKKVIILAIGAILVGGAIGSAGTYQFIKIDERNNIAPVNINNPTLTEASSLSSSEVDKKITSGSLNPSEIAKSPFAYLNKEVSVKGQLIERDGNAYSIVNSEETQPIGLVVDFSSSNINPKDYAVSANQKRDEKNTPAEAPTITVTGKIAETKQDNLSTFKLQATNVVK